MFQLPIFTQENWHSYGNEEDGEDEGKGEGEGKEAQFSIFDEFQEYENSSHEQYMKDLIFGFISAMSRCDQRELEAVLDPKVVWTIPGTSLVSGPAFGIRGIMKRCAMIRRYNARLDLQRILYGPFKNTIVGELRNTGIRHIGLNKNGMIKFDERVMMLFHIGDNGRGKIESITNFISDVDNLNDYFQ